MIEFRMNRAWLDGLRSRIETAEWVTIPGEQARALVDAAERGLPKEETARLLRFPSDGVVPK